MLDWHKVFGIALIDFFTGTCWKVELEKDLSLKSQFLDVVIIKKDSGKSIGILPDGFENLAMHNLITYKSVNQPLDSWAIRELTSHYVNYRKQISSSPEKMESEERFKLYGVCTRFPENLSKKVKLNKAGKGIYDVIWGDMPVRVIVLSQASEKEQNAIWNIFSAVPETVRNGAANYKNRSPETSKALLSELFERYKLEGFDMPYTMEDFQKDVARDFLHTLSPDEVLGRFSSDEVVRRFSSDEVLGKFSPDERLKGLAPNERLKGLSLKQIKAYLAKIEQN